MLSAREGEPGRWQQAKRQHEQRQHAGSPTELGRDHLAEWRRCQRTERAGTGNESPAPADIRQDRSAFCG
jgi:hypothetical protein